MLLEQAELKAEQTEAQLERALEEKQKVVDYYKTFLAKSDANKKKHDQAVEEYHKYQLEKLQTRIRQLEAAAAAAAAQDDSDSSVEVQDDDQLEDEPAAKSRRGPSQAVVDLDSDDDEDD